MKKESEFVALYAYLNEVCGHNDRMTAEEVASKVMWKEEAMKEGFLRNASKFKVGGMYKATPNVTIICVYDGSPRKADKEVLEFLDQMKEMLDDYDEHQILCGTDHYRELVENARKKFDGVRRPKPAQTTALVKKRTP